MPRVPLGPLVSVDSSTSWLFKLSIRAIVSFLEAVTSDSVPVAVPVAVPVSVSVSVSVPVPVPVSVPVPVPVTFPAGGSPSETVVGSCPDNKASTCLATSARWSSGNLDYMP